MRSFFLLVISVCCLCFSALPCRADYLPGPGENPSAEGALSAQVVDQLRKSMPATPEFKAIQNAVAENEINALVLDRQKGISDDALFTHVIKTGKITSQEQTGRCWLFAGLNLLRPSIIKKYNLDNFELSQAYSQFWDKLERANRTLELAIALRGEELDGRKMALLLSKPIEDGGDWNYVLFLVDRYGVVPKGVMPDTQSAGHTDQMNRLLSSRMRRGMLEIRRGLAEGGTVESARDKKKEVLRDIYRILSICLGEPPDRFDWRYEDKDKKVSPLKNYTPQSFYREFVGLDLKDYIAFINYPGKPFNAVLSFAWNRDSADGPDMQALNITSSEMKKMAADSVMADEPVWFCCNSSVQRNSKAGLWDIGTQAPSSLFGVDFAMEKGDTLAYLDGAPNHCMVMVGVNIVEGKPDKWKIENSWGDKRGRDGYWTITDSWFDANVYEILINKKFVPKETMKLLDQKPLVMPPWDPFSS